MRSLLCLVAAVALAACATDTAPEAHTASDASSTPDPSVAAASGADAPAVAMDSLVVTEDERNYEFAVSFPQIVDADTEPLRAVNAAIRDSVRSMLDEYRGYTAPPDDEYPYPSMVSGEAEDTYLSDRVLSTVLAVYVFTGGAHGNMVFVPLTFDLQTGEALTASDLFAEDSGWGDTLAEHVERGVVAQLAERMETTEADARTVLFEGGTESVRAGDVALAVGADSLAVHIPQYAFAAYVFGTFRVAVPRSAVAEAARPGGVLDTP